MDITIELAVAFVFGVVATGRITRLIVDDDYPPVVWLREWYVLRVPPAWGELVACAFCVSPYVAAINLGVGWASDFAWFWWVPNVWLAGSYLAAMLTARDIPAE